MHALRKSLRPAFRALRVAPDERVRDGLAGDKRVRHHAAEQVVRAADAEATGFFPGKGLARNKVQRRIALQRRLVAAAELEPLQRRQALRDRHARGDLMVCQAFIARIGDDGAHYL